MGEENPCRYEGILTPRERNLYISLRKLKLNASENQAYLRNQV